MSAPILLADKKLRTKTLRLVAFPAILSLVGIRSLMVYLDELTVLQLTAPQLAAEKYSCLLFFFGVANVLIACGAGAMLGFIFGKALKAKQFPPPGIRLMWDTNLRTGKEARCLALAGVAVTIILTLGGIGLGTVMISLARPPTFPGPFLEASMVSGGYFLF